MFVWIGGTQDFLRIRLVDWLPSLTNVCVIWWNNYFIDFTSSEFVEFKAFAVLILSIWTSSSSPSGASGFWHTSLLLGEILEPRAIHESSIWGFHPCIKNTAFFKSYALSRLGNLKTIITSFQWGDSSSLPNLVPVKATAIFSDPCFVHTLHPTYLWKAPFPLSLGNLVSII